MVKPVEKPVEPEPEKQHNDAPSKPPGYASIAAGRDNPGNGNGVPPMNNKNDNIKDEMPTIDDWNEDIAKEEENNGDSREYRGRGGGRGGGGRGRRDGEYRGRGGKT